MIGRTLAHYRITAPIVRIGGAESSPIVLQTGAER
jgi:hypothetical protein